MKQDTNTEQTAKIIELGFEEPNNTRYVQHAKARNLHSPFVEFGEPEFEGSYLIGELIRMLPRVVEDEDSEYATISIYHDTINWVVDYQSPERCFYATSAIELIDALYEMIVKLKEEKIL